MKIQLLLLLLIFGKLSSAQNTVETKNHGTLEFVELDHGVADVIAGKSVKDKNSPTRTHGWLKDFEITKVTDTVQIFRKVNFGVIYIVKAKENADINVDIEWIYPIEITNDKGQRFKSMRYTTKRPTNIPSASSYSLDEDYEMVKGNWTMNIYLENQKVYSKTFSLQ